MHLTHFTIVSLIKKAKKATFFKVTRFFYNFTSKKPNFLSKRKVIYALTPFSVAKISTISVHNKKGGFFKPPKNLLICFNQTIFSIFTTINNVCFVRFSILVDKEVMS